METIDKWYMKEVYFWRTTASLIWYVLCHPAALVVYVTATNFCLNPIRWLSEGVEVLFSLPTYGWFLLITCLNLLFAYFTASRFKVMPEVYARRLDMILSLLRPSRLAHGALCALLGAAVALCCTNITRGRYLGLIAVNDDVGSTLVLNESHLFLVLFGAFSGLHFYTLFYCCLLDYLEFPLLQEPKFFQVKGLARSLLHHSCWLVARQIKNFYLLYFLCGSIIRDWVIELLGLQLSGEVRPLDTLLGLLDVALLWQAALVGLLVTFTWNFYVLLYRAYHTQLYQFQLSAGLTSKQPRQLALALACPQSPLTQYLGFFDMWHLSKFSPDRRQEVFSLSQPGGHPHVWNSLSAACLVELQQLNAQLQECNWRTMASVPLRNLPPSLASDRTNATFVRNIGPNLTFRDQASTMANSVPPPEASPPPPPSFRSKLSGRLALLSRKPVICYFLAEFPETKTRLLFCKAQLHIWAVEGLSSLVAASYTEDRFGVVQGALPNILATMLDLLENMEKYMKMTGGGGMQAKRQVQASPILPFDIPLRGKLQLSLKTAIHRMVDTFGSHVLDLKLTEDHLKRLRLFQDYQD